MVTTDGENTLEIFKVMSGTYKVLYFFARYNEVPTRSFVGRQALGDYLERELGIALSDFGLSSIREQEMPQRENARLIKKIQETSPPWHKKNEKNIFLGEIKCCLK